MVQIFKKVRTKTTLSYCAGSMFAWVKMAIKKAVFKGKRWRRRYSSTELRSFFFLPLDTRGMKAGTEAGSEPGPEQGSARRPPYHAAGNTAGLVLSIPPDALLTASLCVCLLGCIHVFSRLTSLEGYKHYIPFQRSEYIPLPEK